MERSRTLRFAVGTSLLAIATSCNTEDTTIDDASPRAIDVVLPGDEGDEETVGDTTTNPGPQPDVGGPVDPDDDVETPPPPPIVNPGAVQDMR
ncbi:MAG TPA: hypothetical protein VG755_26595 [Nannocystaceae bacterium]|nr:hypothetical protein [Nannocystaceae bacterium]